MKLEDICPICSSVKDGVLKYIIDTHYIITPKFITNRYYLHLLYSFVLSFFAIWFLIEFAHLAETPIWFQLFVGGFGAFAENFVYGPTFELLRELKDTYTYPVEGWSWYNEKPYQDTEPEILDIPNDSFLNIPLI